MTVREWMNTYLEDRGLFPEESAAIMKAVMEDPDLSPMKGRWEDDVRSYQLHMIQAISWTVCDHALQWIDAVNPQHYARGLFVLQSPPK